MKLGLEIAKELIARAEEEAERIGVQMVITIVDDGGNLIASHRMDDAWLASIDIAENKAWTAVALKTKTADLAEATTPHSELFGLNTTNNGRIVVFGGGIPLENENGIIGAIGVSGSSVENDIRVAEAGAELFTQQVEKMR
ncbi:hypothetical protein JCM19045_2228 [Bacillus sp. JCM 19045]|nr:hypothetical protein JCM19045_2228 [Bacillus sp. JCM 19045]